MNNAKKLGMISAAIISNVGAGGTCSICKLEFKAGEQLICFETGSYHGPDLEGLKGIKAGVAHLNCLSLTMGGQKILMDGMTVSSVVVQKQPLLELATPFGTMRIAASKGCDLAFKLIVAAAFGIADSLAWNFLITHGIEQQEIVDCLIVTRELRHSRMQENSAEMPSTFSLEKLFETLIGLSLDIFLEQSKLRFNLDSAAYLRWQEVRGNSILQ